MRLLLDENMPADAVEALRLAGHDVAFVTEGDPSAADPDLLARVVREDRVLVTFDTRLWIPDLPGPVTSKLRRGHISAYSRHTSRCAGEVGGWRNHGTGWLARLFLGDQLAS